MPQSWLRNWPLNFKLQLYGVLAVAVGLIAGFGGEYIGSLAMRRVGLALVAAGVFSGGAGVIWAFFAGLPRSIRQVVAAAPWRDLGRVDSRTGRPRIITLICVFGFGVAGGLALSAVLVNILPGFGHLQADWTPSAAQALVVFGTAVALGGYWRMQRWGVWLLGAVVAAEACWMVLAGSPLRDWGDLLTGPVVFLLVGARYYQRMV